ncbi:MAG: NAD(P)/FAD-dependent oxidoreductase [Candidatus Eremiobacteraeota bacterium]|nr:NAD(P)/FAD-dependent oxidoreductase [Candidatus Eremiobacteraeota bacterium]
MKYAVVGGGLLGMTTAWNLSKAGHDVTIFERAESCGGLASAWELGGVVWDRHYHVTLASDRNLRAMLAALDLDTELRWIKARTGFYVDGALHPFSGIRDYLRFPPLSAWQKLRLGRAIQRAAKITDWRPLERLTAVQWLTQLCGRDIVERIWLPLLRAKLGSSAERASAAFIWAIIARMYGARRTGNKQELFGYMSGGGYNRTVRRFEECLRMAGVRIRTGCSVTSVEPYDGRISVAAAEGTGIFDRALVTLVPPLAARICSSLSPHERALCAGVEYQGIICASVLLTHALTPYYITNIADRDVPFTAVIEMTALVDRSELGGKSLVYLPKYVGSDDPALHWDDPDVEKTFLGALERMHSTFSRDSVAAFRVSRVPYVFPIPTLDYSKRLPPMRTSTPGLYMASSAHIVNGTLNVNETVTLANAVSAMLEAEPAEPRLEVVA